RCASLEFDSHFLPSYVAAIAMPVELAAVGGYIVSTAQCVELMPISTTHMSTVALKVICVPPFVPVVPARVPTVTAPVPTPATVDIRTTRGAAELYTQTSVLREPVSGASRTYSPAA